ncbi:MAG: hypothetical protein LBG58_05525 [Planctomycetaceae bacterium]|jgi:hypothetical protein|nr:hypothetical protein [Planctomycetaceae bacterium]
MRIITGTVKDHQGKPVGDAYVGGGEQCLQLPFVKSKADGSFRLPYFSSHFKLSLVQIYAIKPGVGFAYQVTDELYKWAGETPPDKISKSPFHLVLNKPQTVQVRITDENEIPIPNVIVTPHFLVSTKSKGLKQQDYF